MLKKVFKDLKVKQDQMQERQQVMQEEQMKAKWRPMKI